MEKVGNTYAYINDGTNTDGVETGICWADACILATICFINISG